MKELGYDDNDILLILHADDLGFHPAETDATLDAIKNGLISSTSIMAPCPDFDRSVELLKQNPHIDVGIHLTLTNEWQEAWPWSPVLSQQQVPSLYNKKKLMWPREVDFEEHADPTEAILELDAQIQKVLTAGIVPTHLDGHMWTIYGNARVYQGVMDLAEKYQLPMLQGFAPESMLRKRAERNFIPFTSTECIYGIEGETSTTPQLRKSSYLQYLENLTPGLHALLLHPAYTEKMGGWLEMPYVRSGDYKVWTDPDVKLKLNELGIKVIDYGPIAAAQKKLWNSKN